MFGAAATVAPAVEFRLDSWEMTYFTPTESTGNDVMSTHACKQTPGAKPQLSKRGAPGDPAQA